MRLRPAKSVRKACYASAPRDPEAQSSPCLAIARNPGGSIVASLRCRSRCLFHSLPPLRFLRHWRRSASEPVSLPASTLPIPATGGGRVTAPAELGDTITIEGAPLRLAQSAHCSLPFAMLVSPASSTPPPSATGGAGVSEPSMHPREFDPTILHMACRAACLPPRLTYTVRHHETYITTGPHFYLRRNSECMPMTTIHVQ